MATTLFIYNLLVLNWRKAKCLFHILAPHNWILKNPVPTIFHGVLWEVKKNKDFFCFSNLHVRYIIQGVMDCTCISLSLFCQLQNNFLFQFKHCEKANKFNIKSYHISRHKERVREQLDLLTLNKNSIKLIV